MSRSFHAIHKSGDVAFDEVERELNMHPNASVESRTVRWRFH